MLTRQRQPAPPEDPADDPKEGPARDLTKDPKEDPTVSTWRRMQVIVDAARTTVELLRWLTDGGPGRL